MIKDIFVRKGVSLSQGVLLSFAEQSAFANEKFSKDLAKHSDHSVKNDLVKKRLNFSFFRCLKKIEKSFCR